MGALISSIAPHSLVSLHRFLNPHFEGNKGKKNFPNKALLRKCRSKAKKKKKSVPLLRVVANRTIYILPYKGKKKKTLDLPV